MIRSSFNVLRAATDNFVGTLSDLGNYVKGMLEDLGNNEWSKQCP